MDLIDRAAQSEQNHRDDALFTRRVAAMKKLRSAVYCRDCGERIPEARRKAILGVCYCTDCAGDIERKTRQKFVNAGVFL